MQSSDALKLQSDPKMIKEIVDAVTIPVMAKCRIGHFVEAQVRIKHRPYLFLFHGVYST